MSAPDGKWTAIHPVMTDLVEREQLAVVASVMIMALFVARWPYAPIAMRAGAKAARRVKATRRAQSAAKAAGKARRSRRPRWPVRSPDAAARARFFPAKRIVAFYGNPLSKRMGILGELPPDRCSPSSTARSRRGTRPIPSTPVQPALHLIAVVARRRRARRASTARAWTAR